MLRPLENSHPQSDALVVKRNDCSHAIRLWRAWGESKQDPCVVDMTKSLPCLKATAAQAKLLLFWEHGDSLRLGLKTPASCRTVCCR